MTIDRASVRQVTQQAWQALQRGDLNQARRLAEAASIAAPELEDPWLILAGLSTPRESIGFLERALEINPKSERARKGMRWAVQQLREREHGTGQVHNLSTEAGKHVQAERHPVTPPPSGDAPGRTDEPVPDPITHLLNTEPSIPAPSQPAAPPPGSSPRLSKSNRRWLLLPAAALILCAALVWALWPGNAVPALAFLRAGNNPQATPTLPGAPADIAKPSYTPSLTPTFTSTPTFTPTATPTFTPTLTPTHTPSPTPTNTNTPIPTDTPTPSITPTASDTPLPTDTPLYTDTPVPTIPVYDPNDPCYGGGEARWISVDLSQQRLYACEFGATAASFVVSTGTSLHPTVTGDYRIYVKLLSTTMSGPDYYLPKVPYTMYFYQGYGIHGTYWHNNFGVPMSHGCINMRTSEAGWLFDWASVGTLVHVHY
jgi:lipoprotein-anchoring transpeptidase ErfK/SrfK